MNAVIIQARLGSTRLPQKTMKKIMGKPLLYYSVKRCSLSKYVDEVIVATTTNENDDDIEKWCKSESIKCYRGSEFDVLDRYYNAAKTFNVDNIIRVTSDCPFIDPSIIDMLIVYFKNFDYDNVVNRRKTRSWPHGLDAEVFTFKALEKAWKEAKKDFEREHVTPYILGHSELFATYEVPYNKDLSKIRLTVDYLEDFLFAEKLLKALMGSYGIEFTWKDVICEINKDPDILEINKSRINTSM